MRRGQDLGRALLDAPLWTPTRVIDAYRTVPLVALLFFGRGDRNELWPLIGVGVLVLTSVWRYFTYRYAVQADHVVVRSGVLERSARVIPFARIHNVALQQSVLHRLFRVAEVKLESAGGKRPEAEMRLICTA